MKFATAEISGVEMPGVLSDDETELYPLRALGYPNVLELLSSPDGVNLKELSEFRASGAWVPVSMDGAKFLPPLPRPPRNIFCVAVNYKSHLEEGAAARPADAFSETRPVFFTKAWTTLTPHGGEVVVDPRITESVDWEAEVAVVIGRGGSFIDREVAEDHVFGYCLANDVSARDVQFEGGSWSQWFRGKSLDTACPMGPYIVTTDEVAPADISFTLSVNGVEKQSSNMDYLTRDVPTLISMLSEGISLLPGDIILTGTPGGVGWRREPPEFLRDGDTVEIASPALGTLSHTFRVPRG